MFDDLDTETIASHGPDDHIQLDLADIRIETTVSSDSNDITVVITNSGKQAARIAQLEPALCMTARGVFNFSRLLEEGQLTLAPGESVHVVMTPRGLLPEAASPAFLSASLLSSQLCQSFKVVSAEPAIGQVHVLEGVRMV